MITSGEFCSKNPISKPLLSNEESELEKLESELIVPSIDQLETDDLMKKLEGCS